MADKMINDGEEQEEALFHSYMTCPVYYVQSPSNASHGNSSDCRNHVIESAFPSPSDPFPVSHDFNITNHPTINATQDVSRFVLSRYSSSRGSNNSFHHQKNISYVDDRHGSTAGNDHGHPLRVDHRDQDDDIDDDDDDDDDDDEDGDAHDDQKNHSYGGGGGGGGNNSDQKRIRRRRKGCRRFFSFDSSSSCCWISLQIVWRLMVSFAAALLVFYLATKPPPPKISVKMAGVRQFVFGEGVDESGVSTKILTCNCSISLAVDNKSKIFGLHIRPSKIEMSFGPLVFATSQGTELYALSHGLSTFELFVGTRNKPMYGAGRSMQDMLESGKGLPLLIHIKLRSSFKVVGNLINPIFHHKAECTLVLNHGYDKQHHTQAYNSSCMIAFTR